jgi:hypothetical protein
MGTVRGAISGKLFYAPCLKDMNSDSGDKKDVPAAPSA